MLPLLPRARLRAPTVIGVTALWLACLLAARAPAALAQTPPPAVRAGQPVTLNFVEADIEAVARAMGVMSGRHIVVDPRVKGTLTLVTETPVTPAAAIGQFGAELRLRGFALVESQGLYKVVPEAEAKLHGGPVLTDDQTPRNGQLVTQIFRLQHENANHLLTILRPLISPNNVISANAASNALVITDYADNLRRLARIIAALDVASGTDVEVIPLQHAVASDLVPLLQRLLDGDGGRPAVAGQPQGQAPVALSSRTIRRPATGSW